LLEAVLGNSTATNATFVCQMEEVLEVYTRAYDPDHPVICFDQSNKQLVSERVEPLPMQPDQPARYDYQYQRNVTVCAICLSSLNR
jgi:hypothetical protein